jgi:hypothetical protein
MLLLHVQLQNSTLHGLFSRREAAYLEQAHRRSGAVGRRPHVAPGPSVRHEPQVRARLLCPDRSDSPTTRSRERPREPGALRALAQRLMAGELPVACLR